MARYYNTSRSSITIHMGDGSPRVVPAKAEIEIHPEDGSSASLILALKRDLVRLPDLDTSLLQQEVKEEKSSGSMESSGDSDIMQDVPADPELKSEGDAP